MLGDKTTNYGSFHELDAWIAIAPSGRIFASNTGGNLIKVFDASGRPLFVFGGHGDAPGRFLILAGVAVTNTRCYALDLSAGRILAFDLPSI